jgi:hypothetical protein
MRLWRALLPTLAASLAPGGVLVYETFADGHQHFGRPARADFLLRRGELLAGAWAEAFGGIKVGPRGPPLLGGKAPSARSAAELVPPDQQ